MKLFQSHYLRPVAPVTPDPGCRAVNPMTPGI